MNPGFVKNCLLIPRQDTDEPMFVVDEEGNIAPTLDGYTILPNDQYEALKETKP